MPTENGVYGVDGAYLSADGYPQGWSLVDGTYYYKEGENFVINQAKKINGDWYLFDVHGRMVTGFSTSDFDIRGWKNYYYDEGNFYYGADGRRCSYVGWQVIDGNWYYFDQDGIMLTSQWIGAYYVKADGTMARSEWVENGKYYVDENGIWDSSKVAKWQISNGRWWYSHADGSYTTNGWENIDGEWYYFDGSGYMASSCWIGVYYVKENGKMAHSEWVDNGRYYVDENGVWVQGAAAY